MISPIKRPQGPFFVGKMKEILGATYESAMRDVNCNVLQEHVNHVLILRGEITPDEFHDDIDRLIYERDTLMVEISQNIIDRCDNPRVQSLLAIAAEALVREKEFRNVAGSSFDLPFVEKFFSKLVDFRSN